MTEDLQWHEAWVVSCAYEDRGSQAFLHDCLNQMGVASPGFATRKSSRPSLYASATSCPCYWQPKDWIK